MKPEFQAHKVNLGKPSSIRLPEDLKARLEIIAGVEGGGVAGLLIEGAVRVIQDRASDPSFQQQVAERIERKR